MTMTQSELKTLLEYNPEKGMLFWRERTADQYPNAKYPQLAADQFNARHAGEETFITKHADGRLVGTIFQKIYMKTRVIWCIQTGEWLNQQVRHRNGDISDCRFSNLILARDCENYCISKQNGKYMVRVNENGIAKYLGIFRTLEIAKIARDKALKERDGNG